MSRREIAENYTNGENGLEVPSFGRIKVVWRLKDKILSDFPKIAEAFEEHSAFEAWFDKICEEDDNPAGLDKIKDCLRDAFEAGGGGGNVLDLGRLQHAAPLVGELIAAFYLMPFSKFRTLSPANYQKECEEFAEELPIERVAECIRALVTDWKAIEASLVDLAPDEEGKDRAGEREAERSLSLAPH